MQAQREHSYVSSRSAPVTSPEAAAIGAEVPGRPTSDSYSQQAARSGQLGGVAGSSPSVPTVQPVSRKSALAAAAVGTGLGWAQDRLGTRHCPCGTSAGGRPAGSRECASDVLSACLVRETSVPDATRSARTDTGASPWRTRWPGTNQLTTVSDSVVVATEFLATTTVAMIEGHRRNTRAETAFVRTGVQARSGQRRDSSASVSAQSTANAATSTNLD
jgi:hypothetical protein